MKLTLTTDDGEVIEVWNLNDSDEGYDIWSPIARQFLMAELLDASTQHKVKAPARVMDSL